MAHQQRRAKQGNGFIHFTIRCLSAAANARGRGFVVASLLEHPEDLGMTHRGEPASIWQLEAIRTVFGNGTFKTVAGHQCQYPDTDRKKPTRLLSDLDDIDEFGHVGWPVFDAGGYYVGPLPLHCGHSHRQKTIGKSANGGFNTAPFAAYPAGMCKFIATKIFNHWYKRIDRQTPVGVGLTSSRSLPLASTSTT